MLYQCNYYRETLFDYKLSTIGYWLLFEKFEPPPLKIFLVRPGIDVIFLP